MEINIIKEENGKVHGEIISSNGKKTILTPIFPNKKQEKEIFKTSQKYKGNTKTLELKRININI